MTRQLAGRELNLEDRRRPRKAYTHPEYRTDPRPCPCRDDVRDPRRRSGKRRYRARARNQIDSRSAFAAA